MASYSIDYLFNRVYDFLLWIKYTWLFTIIKTKPEDYLALQSKNKWDGLRDRGWFNDYFASKEVVVPPVENHISLWHKVLNHFGMTPHQDNVPNPDLDKTLDQDFPEDLKYCLEEYKNHITSAEIKERYQADYSFSDNIRDVFGMAPTDTSGGGVPDSYKIAHGLDINTKDTDHDGLPDAVELCYGTDALNNDTDHDGVLDGRDEAPLDPMLSSKNVDSDGDGVSDVMELQLGMNPYDKDTDHDGIPDGMDTYPLDSNNIDPTPIIDFSKQIDSVQFHIQSPFFTFISKIFSVLAILGLVLLIAFLLWFVYEYWVAQLHYEHHFNDTHGHGRGHGDSGHVENKDNHATAGIHGLAVGEYVAPHSPTNEEFRAHPRWAIIEGYMASETNALWRIGVIEADTMLAEVLRDKGYKGADVGEMLNSASFKTVQLAWDAHKIRNKIAHEGSNFILTEREAKRAYALYEAVFKELKAI